MSMSVVYNLNGLNKMLKARGLNASGKVAIALPHILAREMDPYVPMSAGASAHFKNRRRAEMDGVVYPGPYARYLYFGKVMVGRAPKKVIDKNLTYHGAPKRGAFWDRRMWRDKKIKVLSELASLAGGDISW